MTFIWNQRIAFSSELHSSGYIDVNDQEAHKQGELSPIANLTSTPLEFTFDTSDSMDLQRQRILLLGYV